jgi:uncharacterized repeat protein (TIGR03803 family)
VQSYHILTRFGLTPTDGEEPIGVIAFGNSLWGTTIDGGSPASFGTIFRITANAGRQTIFAFNYEGPDMGFPGSLLAGPDSRVYGTTGSSLFWVDTATLSFQSLLFDSIPYAPIGPGPVLTSDGLRTIYGTVQTASITTPDCGALFAYDIPTGGLSVIATFPWGNAACPNGQLNGGTLAYASGYIFGTVTTLQPPTAGAIFRVRADGTNFSTIHAFSGGSDGAYPGGLFISRGRLYGFASGAMGRPFPPTQPAITPTLYSMNLDGSGFTVLHRFPGGNYFESPSALLMTRDGKLCGTAGVPFYGGRGYVFCQSQAGIFTILHTFRGQLDGAGPVALIETLPGVLVGATEDGGGAGCYLNEGCGTVFEVGEQGPYVPL